MRRWTTAEYVARILVTYLAGVFWRPPPDDADDEPDEPGEEC